MSRESSRSVPGLLPVDGGLQCISMLSHKLISVLSIQDLDIFGPYPSGIGEGCNVDGQLIQIITFRDLVLLAILVQIRETNQNVHE